MCLYITRFLYSNLVYKSADHYIFYIHRLYRNCNLIRRLDAHSSYRLKLPRHDSGSKRMDWTPHIIVVMVEVTEIPVMYNSFKVLVIRIFFKVYAYYAILSRLICQSICSTKSRPQREFFILWLLENWFGIRGLRKKCLMIRELFCCFINRYVFIFFFENLSFIHYFFIRTCDTLIIEPVKNTT